MINGKGFQILNTNDVRILNAVNMKGSNKFTINILFYF